LQGVVCGRGTGGSAVAVLKDPILSSALAKADSKTKSETSVAANFESWEVVTETSIVCANSCRAGSGLRDEKPQW
jgi:hypothetical protein